MPKKKSDKEGKENKQAAKRAAVKEAKAAMAPEAAPAAGLKKGKPLTAGKEVAPRKKAPGKAPLITGEDINLRAYFIAERRQKMGWPGDSTSDWVEAERQLKAEAARKK